MRYKFPAREKMPAVQLTWWDGGLMPPRPPGFEEGRRMGDDDGGVLLLGEQGRRSWPAATGAARGSIPEPRMQEYKQAGRRRSTASPTGEDGHEQDWIRACKGGKPASSNFDYSGPLSEMVLMGNLAVRFPDQQLLWDGEAMEVTNDKDANAYVRRQYREGFPLPTGV